MVFIEQVADPALRCDLASQRLDQLPASIREEYMGVSEILAVIDHEIAKLQQARALLGSGAATAPKKKAGRPKKVVVAAPVATKPAKKKKRHLSSEGRRRIAEAVKKRWAAQKAAAAK